MKAREWALEAIAFLSALLFLYTAMSKLADPERFSAQLDNQVFNNAYTPFLTYGIPVAELIVVCLIAYPKTRIYGFAGFSLAMAVFTIYVALIMAGYFDRVPCGCASAFEKLSWPWHLTINAGFTLLGIVGYILQKLENTEPDIEQIAASDLL